MTCSTSQGTPEFWAAEIFSQSYLFKTPGHLDFLDMIETNTPELPLPPVISNPYHDLESLFWIALWYLFTYVPSEVNVTKADQRRHLKTFNDLFYCNPEPLGRSRIFFPGGSEALRGELTARGWHNAIAPVTRLPYFARALFNSYQALECLPQANNRWRLDDFGDAPYDYFVKLLEVVGSTGGADLSLACTNVRDLQPQL